MRQVRAGEIRAAEGGRWRNSRRTCTSARPWRRRSWRRSGSRLDAGVVEVGALQIARGAIDDAGMDARDGGGVIGRRGGRLADAKGQKGSGRVKSLGTGRCLASKRLPPVLQPPCPAFRIAGNGSFRRRGRRKTGRCSIRRKPCPSASRACRPNPSPACSPSATPNSRPATSAGVTAETPRSAPCRITLEDAAPGETLLLLPFAHQTARSPFQASGPIFVREGGATFDAVDTLPPVFNGRLLSVSPAYDGEGMMLHADIVESDPRELFATFFDDPAVDTCTSIMRGAAAIPAGSSAPDRNRLIVFSRRTPPMAFGGVLLRPRAPASAAACASPTCTDFGSPRS